MGCSLILLKFVCTGIRLVLGMGTESERELAMGVYMGTRMRGKAQPDGRPVVELIKTPVLSPVVDQITTVYH